MHTNRRGNGLLRSVGRAFLALDAFVDSSLYNARRGAIASYAAYSAFLDRFHVSGVGKFAVEMACEGLTIGLAGLRFCAGPGSARHSRDRRRRTG